jgi:hypothetical protein
MSRTTIGALLLLGGSLLFGFLSGRSFFQLFLQNLPPLALSSFSTTAAHAAFLTYGIILGLLLFAWSVLAVVLSRFFTRRPGGSPTKSA